MKMLMWHCREYQAKLVGISNRPPDIQPEEKRSEHEKAENCILAMVTVEKGDDDSKADQAAEEIKKFAKDTKPKNIVLLPFVHLSNDIADPETTVTLLKAIEDSLNQLKVLRSHFGYDKQLKFDVFGHKTNVRFRTF